MLRGVPQLRWPPPKSLLEGQGILLQLLNCKCVNIPPVSLLRMGWLGGWGWGMGMGRSRGGPLQLQLQWRWMKASDFFPAPAPSSLIPHANVCLYV